MSSRFIQSTVRNGPWVFLALVVGALVGIALGRFFPPHDRHAGGAYDHELAAIFKSTPETADLSESPPAESIGDPRTVAEFRAEFDRLSANLTPGAAYPLANLFKAWLAQHPDSAFEALESLGASPDAFPLALLVAECGSAHGELLHEHWKKKPAILGARYASGIAAFLKDVDGVAAYEAAFWSHRLPEGKDGTLFQEIVHETSALSVALAKCSATEELPAGALKALYRALGHKHGQKILEVSGVPEDVLFGMLEQASLDSEPEALTQALQLGEENLLPRLMAVLWDRDDEALRSAIEAVESGRARQKLTKAFFVEALDRVDPSEILGVWEDCTRLGGRKPFDDDDELRKATQNNELFAFPILATAFKHRMFSRGPALDYGELCSRALGKRLLQSDHVSRELKLGLRVSLFQGPVEDLIAQLPPDVTSGHVSFKRAAAVMDRGRVNPNEALELAKQLKDPISRDFAFRGIVHSPTAAMLPDIAKRAISASEDPKERVGATEAWAHLLGMHNPHEGSKLLGEIHREQPLSDQAIAWFVQTSAETDIDGAMAWLDQVKDQKIRKQTLGLIKSWLDKK